MMKLFKTQKLKLCAAACALFALGSLGQASADNAIEDGYYYIKFTYGETNATTLDGIDYSQDYTPCLRYIGRQLRWALQDKNSADQIFYVQKATESTHEDAYYLQNAGTGEWYAGASSLFSPEMRGIDERKILVFKYNSTTKKYAIVGDRGDQYYTNDDETYQYADNIYNCLRPSANVTSGHKTYKSFNYGGFTTSAYWEFEPLDNNALLNLKISKALDVYDNTLAYIAGTTNLVTSSNYKPSSTNTTSGYLTDNNPLAYLWTKSSNAKSGESITTPQWLQVDLGSNYKSKGVQMTLAPCFNATKNSFIDYFWSNVTLYATNDESSASSDLTLEACQNNAIWTKIRDKEIDADGLMTLGTKTEYGNVQPYQVVATRDGITNWNTWKTQKTFYIGDEGYQYLRFFVNRTIFYHTNSLPETMEWIISQFQLNEMENVEYPAPKKVAAEELLTAINNAKEALSGTVTDEQLSTLETAIDNAIEKVQNYEIVTISDLGYASFYSEENVIMPEGLEAFAVTATTDNTATLTSVAQASEVLPAKTPVILKGDPGNYELTVTSETGTAVTGNLLSGTYTPLEQTEGTTYYVLSKNSEGKAALMKYNEGNVLHSGKAYLIPTTTASSKFLNFSFDAATGIQSAVNEESNKDVKTYDLEGRSVKHPQKGIYIRDGKKVVIK